MHTHSVGTPLSAGLLDTCFALLIATRYSCMLWFRDLASPGKSRQVLANFGHESIIPCCTDFCYVQQTRLPTPETASGHSQLRPGRGPARWQMVAAARRGNGLILSSGKLSTSEKNQAIFSRCTSSRQVGTAADPVDRPNNRIVRTPRWWATTQRAICNRGKKLALSEYPYIRQWLQWLRRRGEGRGRRG
jgi:hypothetical protein